MHSCRIRRIFVLFLRHTAHQYPNECAASQNPYLILFIFKQPNNASSHFPCKNQMGERCIILPPRLQAVNQHIVFSDTDSGTSRNNKGNKINNCSPCFPMFFMLLQEERDTPECCFLETRKHFVQRWLSCLPGVSFKVKDPAKIRISTTDTSGEAQPSMAWQLQHKQAVIYYLCSCKRNQRHPCQLSFPRYS